MPKFFTNYKYDPDFLADAAAQAVQNLKSNQGMSNLLDFGLSVIWARLEDKPIRYRDYGVYWWAIKELLRNQGYPVGTQSDPIVLAEYQYSTPEQTLLAADTFRKDYLRTFILGSNEYMLNPDDPETYVLFDADMEQLAPA